MDYEEYEYDNPEKRIPSNIDAEMSTLGSILIDAEAIYKTVHLLIRNLFKLYLMHKQSK